MNDKSRRGVRVQSSKDQNGLQHTSLEQVEEYSQYPSVEFIQQLNAIDPNLVKQVIDMAEREQQHRHEIVKQQIAETQTVNAAHIAYDLEKLNVLKRGQRFGFALNIAILLVVGFALYQGDSVIAGMGIGIIVAILIVYVLQKEPKTPPNDNAE